MVTSILIGLCGLILLILICGLFMKKDHFVKRGIVINAPRQEVYDFLRFLKNQEKFIYLFSLLQLLVQNH